MKITFLGAGSTIFAKSVLGDCILTPELGEFEIALFDIDHQRLDDSRQMLENINRNYQGKAKIKAYHNRLEALRDADFVINAVQIGGYEPCTVNDFEIPKKYGLRQTIADTLGIGGIFRALRTIPVIEDFCADIRKVCPDALFINYVNPMAMITGYIQRYLGVKAVGLCHSVQVCVRDLFKSLEMEEYYPECKWEMAGINHQAWLLKVSDSEGNDLYPEIKKRSLSGKYTEKMAWDLVRHDLMHRFDYYITESSEHNAEYTPYYIKSKYPELIEKYRIPLDEYPRRCLRQIERWKVQREQVVSSNIVHNKSLEYAASIIKAMITDQPSRVHGNVLNTGLITNLPQNACVEVPCLVDRNGIHPCYVGALPEQCAALNRTNINVQNLVLEAARTKRKDYVYMAAYLDPHTSAELSMDDIKNMCDDLFEAHKDWLPEYL
jgi:alpha-galactosidase